MNLARCLRRFGAAAYCPRAAFVFSGSQERNQIEQGVGGFDQLVQTGFLDAELRKEHRAFLLFQFRHLRFDFRADNNNLRTLCGSNFADGLDIRILASLRIRNPVIRNVRDINNRFVG